MYKLNPEYFYFDMPLYEKVEIKETELNDFSNFLLNTDPINAYNPILKENTTYQIKALDYFEYLSINNNGGTFIRLLTCLRTNFIFKVYCFYSFSEKIFMKIGQYPSIADFHISKIKQYDKVLSKEELKEFTRGIGLAANGVGIGSFVYLRRIFESLINNSFSEHKQKLNIEVNDFIGKRMDDKIEILKDYLPPFLVENKAIYKILSSGIHELTEDKCLEYFEIVKVGIELILDDKEEIRQKELKVKNAKAKISDLNSKISKKQ